MATQQNIYGEWQLNDNGIEWKDWKSSNLALPKRANLLPTFNLLLLEQKVLQCILV